MQSQWRCPVCSALQLGFVIPQCRNGNCPMYMSKVPWEDWLSQEKTVLTKHDFPGEQLDFRNAVYRAAASLDLEVVVSLRGDGGVEIEVRSPPERNALLRLLQSRKPLLT